MANFAQLKAAIQQAVDWDNHNNEISGLDMLGILNTMINSLGAGYMFAGVAKLTPTQTDPGTPDQNVFYIAAEPGTYTNFPISGGYLQVAENEVAIFKYNGQWSKETTGAASAAQLNQLGQEVNNNRVSVSQNNQTIEIGGEEVGALGGVYESNSEFITVWVDSERKVLMGINTDGNVFFGKGCPRQVKLYVQKQIKNLSLDEYPDIVTFLGSLIEGDTLTNLLNGKVNKVTGKSLIDGEFATNIPTFISAIENNEYLEATTDYYDKVLESVSKKGVRNIKRLQVWDIDNINKADILNIYPKEIYAPIFRNYKFWTDSQNGPTDTPDTNPLTLLWFSDNHGSVNNLRRIVKFNNQYKQYFDDVLFNGDGVTMSVGDDISHWAKEGAGSFLFCIGNHDITNNQVGGTTYIGQKQTYERYLEPFLSQTGITCPVNHTYWYKDYPSAISDENSGGIRLISVDMYHWKETISGSYSDGTSVDTGEQKVWFEALLADALTNHLAVIVTRHDPIIEATDINCSFNSLHRVQNNINDDTELALAVHNFIEDGGEFIAYLCGDTHQDWFTRREDYPEQLQIVVANSGCMTLWRDLELIPATKYMDRFDIISIEPIQKFIRLFRIGVDYDRHGRHIGSMVYDYKNKQLISNY